MTVKKSASVRTLDAEKLKTLVIDEIDARRDQLNELSLKIHANPELAFQEVKAAAWQALASRITPINKNVRIFSFPTYWLRLAFNLPLIMPFISIANSIIKHC